MFLLSVRCVHKYYCNCNLCFHDSVMYHCLLGKGSEDKRGQPVVYNGTEKSWLYLTPVICTRQMEVAAMVTAINPAISSTADSLDMAVLQQVLYSVWHRS